MRIGYLDCFSGAAGDMWVGALLDLGLDIASLEAAVASLRLPGVRISAHKVRRAALGATWFQVATGSDVPKARDAAAGNALPATGHDEGHEHGHAHGHGHSPSHPHAHAHAHPPGRNLDDILRLLQRADLPPEVRERSEAVFRTIAVAEARVHDQPLEAVHFHEVGAEDTIVDVVCAVLGSHLLGVERFYASPVVLGSGTVRCAHGVLPVPAPGTAAILEGVPVVSGGPEGERTTPTGAALLRVLVHEFAPRSLRWVPASSGYGAGSRDDPERPNVLRLTLGELRDPGAAGTLLEVACQLDTASGETVGWLLDALLSRGAADAFAAPVHMKKGRPGWLVTALVEPAHEDAIVRLLLEESSSLGVRTHQVRRTVLERWSETSPTPLGPVRYKCARLPSGRLVRRPEDDEVVRLAREHGLGRGEVLARLAAGAPPASEPFPGGGADLRG